MRSSYEEKTWSGACATVFAISLALAGCPGGDDDDNAVCGNGIQEIGESCDDGNTLDGDGCSATCEREGFCGNGNREPGEECDDGNFDPGDGCDENCQVEEGCGNGRLDVGEECDDDNLTNGDGCSNLCVDEEPGAVCGNGIWETGEGCEDGNTEDGDGCSATCEREDGCGNGTLEGTEQCDDGNNVSGDGCMYDCRTEFFCGDDFCDEENNEACEYCPQDCCPSCGDGTLGPDEECDDGNNEPGDGCSAGCLDEDGTATCGNGIWEVGEECDDGNTDPEDGCDGSCQAEFDCGDGVCDSANHETCVLCPGDCCPDCGDGNLDPGEDCDGQELGGRTCADYCYDSAGSLTCTTSCRIDPSTCTGTLPTCGDDTAGCGEECDGDDLRNQSCASLGFTGGSLSCDSQSCSFDLSQCTDRLWYLSEGFEGSGIPFGWYAGRMWEIGAPGGSFGPASAHGGNRCVGTRIADEYDDDGLYSVDYLETPPIDLTDATAPRMRFYRWFETQPEADGGNLWISTDGGQDFSLVPSALVDPPYDHDLVVQQPAWSGNYAGQGWTPVYADLSGWAGQEVVLRWAFASDAADSAYGGFYVDDVLVMEAAELPVEVLSASPLPSAVSGYLYDVALRAGGGSGTYDWSIVAGTNDGWLSIDSATGVISGTPSGADVGPVTITVRVEESTNPANYVEKTLGLQVLSAIYFNDLETDPSSSWTFPPGMPPLLPALWDWGEATTGPGSCYSGTGCVATGVAANYDASMALLGGVVSTGQIDLTGATAPVLTYWQWFQSAPGDGGYITITPDGGAAEEVVPVPAYNDVTAGNPLNPGSGSPAWVGDLSGLGWHLVTVDLSSYAGSVITVDWNLEGSAAGTHPGWYIDDVLIAD